MFSLFDTFSGSLRPLPKTGKPVKLFVCGPTVYDDMHIGHARTYLAFDILVRLLRARGYKINYIQNVTDIDDKIIRRARELKTTPRRLATDFLHRYLADSRSLGIVSVNKYVKATSVIPVIINQIYRLVHRGFAYATPRGVYFRVKKFKPYGRLSHQDITTLRSGYRAEPDPGKEDVLDFALWKKVTVPAEPSWPSPWGKGRPGWHIEDTAIAEKYFGLQYDLHGGAVDLKFPHHEAEIAQAESLSGRQPFVKIWLHTGFLTVSGQKMSKSLHNFVTVADFLKKYHPDVLRWLALNRHYHSPLNYTSVSASQSVNSLLSLKSFFAYLDSCRFVSPKRPAVTSALERFTRVWNESLDSDFNTPEAIAAVFSLVREINTLGVLYRSEAALIKKTLTSRLKEVGLSIHPSPVPDKVKELISKREVLRAVRDFRRADDLRDAIAALGFRLDDTPSGPVVVRNDLEITPLKKL